MAASSTTATTATATALAPAAARHLDEYHRLSLLLNRHISDLGAASGGPAGGVSRVLVEADLALAEAEGEIKALEVELKGMSAADKRKFRDRISQARSDLLLVRRNFEAAKAKAEKALLLSGGRGPSGRPAGATERLMRGTEQLQDARRVVGETEYIGEGIMGQMESQREQLLRAHGQVEETNWFTRSARQVLNSIHYRNVRHKMCLIAIIVFLIGLIILVFWQGVMRRYGHKK